MGPARTIVLVRHGQTSFNLEGRYQGARDVPLTEEGRREARLLRARLAALVDYEFFTPERTAVVTSSLSRARETAEIAFGLPDRRVHVEPDLRETSFGDFEGLTREEIDERYPGQLAEWIHGDADVAAPGGESRTAVRQRAFAAVHAALTRLPHPTVIFVSHGGVMRQLIGLCFAEGAVPWNINFGNTATHLLRVGKTWSYDREV